MPELPEVETTIRGLKKKVLKRAFVDVWTDWEKTIKKPGFKEFKRTLKKKKIQKIWRRGKNIILELSQGYSLLIHQKLTGHLLYGIWEKKQGKWISKDRNLEDKVNSYIHLIFFLDNKKMLALSDLRKFAKVELWKTKELKFENLGPEPLEKEFTFKKFKQVLKKGKIKQVLMNQEVIAGIGNIYSDEALWRAKIHPLRQDLTEKELKELYKRIKEVLEKSIKLHGESFSDYRDIEGKKGKFDNIRKVYHQEKCFRCNTKIKRLKIGGRSAHFCPKCQI